MQDLQKDRMWELEFDRMQDLQEDRMQDLQDNVVDGKNCLSKEITNQITHIQ